MSRPKSDLDALKEDLRKVYDGDPWHGSSITTVLNGLDADAAMLRSIPRGHNIWELVLHMTGWTREVTSRLRGAAPKSPPEDWPTPPSPGSGTAWRAAQKDLANAQKELESVVDSLSEADLVRWIADQRESSPDAGVTVGTLIRGLLQHHTYHQGQIALLKRAADTFHPSRRRLESTSAPRPPLAPERSRPPPAPARLPLCAGPAGCGRSGVPGRPCSGRGARPPGT